jgi:ubiquinone/menaquinone biosynthesis C-methylase UbiE
VRTPGHVDSYAFFGRGFFDLLPSPPARTLEIACGEGRVSRDLGAAGYDTIGLGLSPTLIGHARSADPDGRYLHADARRLPFQDAAFDLVVAYNALMDIEDLPSAVRESARVLLEMTFTGWTRSVQDYSDALADAGFVMRNVREPTPPDDAQPTERWARWHRIPMFLQVLAVKDRRNG